MPTRGARRAGPSKPPAMNSGPGLHRSAPYWPMPIERARASFAGPSVGAPAPGSAARTSTAPALLPGARATTLKQKCMP